MWVLVRRVRCIHFHQRYTEHKHESSNKKSVLYKWEHNKLKAKNYCCFVYNTSTHTEKGLCYRKLPVWALFSLQIETKIKRRISRWLCNARQTLPHLALQPFWREWNHSKWRQGIQKAYMNEKDTDVNYPWMASKQLQNDDWNFPKHTYFFNFLQHLILRH